jgi:hypothetical protein
MQPSERRAGLAVFIRMRKADPNIIYRDIWPLMPSNCNSHFYAFPPIFIGQSSQSANPAIVK